MVLAIFGGLLMMSCEMNEVVDRDIQDNDTYPVMKDVTELLVLLIIMP